MKVKTVYKCTNCGYKSPKWAGKCPECGEWNTLEEAKKQDRKDLVAVLTQVPKEVDYERMLSHVEGEIATTKQKKDRLPDLHIAGAITIEDRSA